MLCAWPAAAASECKLALVLALDVSGSVDGREYKLQAEGLALGIGARLRREWQGGIVEVVVTEDGFAWQGHVYPSLSAAATAIAGTRWNGPRFFGLRQKTGRAE